MSSQKKVGEKEGKTIDAEGISSNESGIAAEEMLVQERDNLSSSQDKPVDVCQTRRTLQCPQV